MIDLYSFPAESLTRLVPREFQVVGHRWNNVAFGVPEQLLSRYWRPARGDTPEWTLPDGPQWDELPTYVEAQRLYAEMHRPTSTPNAQALADQMDADRRRVAREQFWAALRALPGGTDPDWQYSSHGEDRPDDPLDDDRFRLWDWSHPDRPPRFPRRELRQRYGTTSILFYGELNGLTLPP